MWLQILLLASAAYSKTVPEVEGKQFRNNLDEKIMLYYKDAKYWRRQGASEIQRMLQMEKYQGRAKNVIIFIGDGMGIQTHAMARIYKVCSVNQDINISTGAVQSLYASHKECWCLLSLEPKMDIFELAFPSSLTSFSL